MEELFFDSEFPYEGPEIFASEEDRQKLLSAADEKGIGTIIADLWSPQGVIPFIIHAVKYGHIYVLCGKSIKRGEKNK